MKNFFSLFAAVLFAGSMFAADATLVAGNNASSVKVNDADAIKVGSSKNAGDMSIQVGAGAKSLVFHAAGWKTLKDDKTETTTILLSTEDAGVNLSVEEFEIYNDDNITGSSTKFTIENEEAYELHVTLTGVKDGATISITADRRFVVWGATYDTSSTEAIDNTAVEAKAVKTFENGQLIIIKNGVKYNATGAIVK